MYNRPLCTNCDWLQGSFRFDETKGLTPPKGWQFVALPGTNVFKERYYLIDSDGNKVLTICAVPHSRLLPHDVGTFQVSNPYLYNAPRDKFADWLHCFRCGCFNGVSRWDVCTDFCPTPAEYKTIRNLASGAQYVSGKSEGSIFWHADTYKGRDVRQPHCLSWGSPTSALKFKLYNKSREIGFGTPIVSKPYIVDEWSHHLPDLHNVWRLEFSMTSVNQYAINGRRLGLEEAVTPLFYVSFFSEIKAKRFTVRMNQGRQHGHKNDDTIVPFLRYDMEGCELRKATPFAERSALDDERQVVRRLWFALNTPCVYTDQERYYSLRSTICSMAANPYILAYLDNLVDGSFVDALNKLDISRDEDIVISSPLSC